MLQHLRRHERPEVTVRWIETSAPLPDQSPWEKLTIPEQGIGADTPLMSMRGMIWSFLFSLILWAIIAAIFAIAPDHW